MGKLDNRIHALQERFSKSNSALVKETLQLINVHLEVNTFSSFEEEYSYDEIKGKISSIIQKMLTSNYQHLLNIMYRLDIDENEFKAAISLSDKTKIGDKVAELIIERELQKAATRLKYSQ